jgi:small neutral amino acid transporter SnatA (MarC family)
MKPESRYQAVTAEKNQSLGQLPLAVPLGVGPTVVPDYYLGPPLFVC